MPTLVQPPRAARLLVWIVGFFALAVAFACTSTLEHPERHERPERSERPEPPEPPERFERSMVVMAAAYNSVKAQTNAQPNIGAWGDDLRNHKKSIAVSRDLLKQGLTRGTRVRIEGMSGEYVVLDKMAKRWRKKIDIHMGTDLRAAKRWGVRKVRIFWDPEADGPP